MPLLILVLLLVGAQPARAAERWRWPLRGDVLTPFHITGSPFSPGQHRGIDIAGVPGATVRSACTGRVRFVGRLPGRGRVVSVLCGGVVATYLELGRTAVARGAAVAAGEIVGGVAASHLQLGARRAGQRHGYLDPLSLLGAPPRPPLGVAPVPGRRFPPRTPAPRSARPPRPLSSPPPAGVPLAAWLGLALVAAGTPLGALWRRRRRRAARAAGVEPLPGAGGAAR